MLSSPARILKSVPLFPINVQTPSSQTYINRSDFVCVKNYV